MTPSETTNRRRSAPARDTILVVDDDADILDATREFLETNIAGVDVKTATNADAALDIMAHETIKVLVADYKMPRKDGITLMGEAKKLYPHVEGILITAYLDPGLAERALHEAGVREMFRKPFRPQDLQFAVLSRLFQGTAVEI